MSGFELNKLAASILLAALIAMVVGTVVNILYKPNLSPAQRGYQVDVHGAVESADNAAAEEEATIDIAALMNAANAEEGENVAKKCVACHSLDKDGPNKVGPHLWNIIGRKKAGVGDYQYSQAMIDKGGEWNYDELFHFLRAPKKFIPGTKMSFIGIHKPQDIANVIAFLRQKAHDTQPPLP